MDCPTGLTAIGVLFATTVFPAVGADNLVCVGPYGLRNGAPISSALGIVDPGKEIDLCSDPLNGKEVVGMSCTTRLDSQHGSFYRCELGKDCVNGGVYSNPVRKDDKICIHYKNGGSEKHHIGIKFTLG